MKNILIFLFLVYIPLAAHLQTHEIDPERNVIISTNGMNLREFPNRGSKVLTAIPFGEKVVILNQKSFGTETIGYYPGYGYHNSETRKLKTIPVKGDWVKVSYNGLTGFVFGAYLGYTAPSKKRVKNDVNTDFVLLYSGFSCYYNIYDKSQFHWYGLYKRKTGYELKKISISYFYDDYSKEGLTPFGTMTNDNIDLSLIIGSRLTMKEGNVDGTDFPDQNHNFKIATQNNYELLNKLSMELIDSPYDEYHPLLKLIRGIKEQILNIEDSPTLYSIDWMGDLDRDGKPDYILNYGEKLTLTVLYLSSQASGAQIVKPVAVYYSGYCC